MVGAATTTWGSAFLAGKIAVVSFEPTTVAFLRFFGAMVLLFPIMWVTERNRMKPTKKEWLLFGLLGLTGIAIYNICFFLASKHAPVIKSSLFIAANPVLITILAGLFLKEKITKSHVIGMIIALLGAVIIISEGHIVAMLKLGFAPIDFILVGAVISWALYSVLGRVVLRQYSSLVATTYAVAFGTLFLFPFALAETSWNDVQQATIGAWGAIAHMSIFVTVISFIMYYQGIKVIGAAKASIFINLMPVSAVIMAIIFLGETFTFAHILGAILVCSGVTIGSYFGNAKKKNSDGPKGIVGDEPHVRAN